MTSATHVRTHRFDALTLYLRDDGHVRCGSHIGVEATYTPERWEAIGVAPRAVVDGVGLTCEDSRCTPMSISGVCSRANAAAVTTAVEFLSWARKLGIEAADYEHDSVMLYMANGDEPVLRFDGSSWIVTEL